MTGNRTIVNIPSGQTGYSYNERNWLETVTDPDNGITTYTYDAVGKLVRTDLANGVVELRQYNTINQLLSLRNITVNPTTGQESILTSYTYTLDNVGNRLSVQDQTGRLVSYDYDVLYRLEQERVTQSGTISTTDYTYDPVGNRLSRVDSTEGTTTYTYDANDRLLTEVTGGVTTTYGYDNNGNTISKTTGSETTGYTWNDENRLVGVQTAAGDVLSYVYNSEGIRTSSTTNGVTTEYLIDANRDYAQVLEERVNGNLSVSYVYGRDLISQERGNVTSFYLVDGLGSTTALTDASGIVTDTYTYDAFGELEGQSGSTANSYQFTGEQFDENLEQYYLRARYYAPSHGQFISRDPWEGDLEDPRTLEGYQYGANNPVMHIDPSGNSFLRLMMEAPTTMWWQAAGAIALITAGYYALNSTNINTSLAIVATEAMNATTQLEDELLGAATQAINILKTQVNSELNRRRNELNKWQLIIQMPTGLTAIRPERYEPPLGSKSFIVREYDGDRMRVLGARLKQKNGPINELIARVDYHPLPEFPGYPHTLHYHLGPNANAGRHYVLYPENRIVD